jgi:peroxiredoxin
MASNEVIQNYCTVQGTENICSLSVSTSVNTFTVTATGLALLGTKTRTVSAGTPFTINYWVNAKD